MSIRCASGVNAAAVVMLCTVSCTTDPPDVSRAIESVVQPRFTTQRSGGVVLVARGDALLFRRAFGMASVELGVPMRTDHVLATGSITKQFTAAAILRLVSQGKLSLDEDARRFVPSFRFARPVTVDQLLSHTSGLANVVDRPDFETIARQDYTPDQLIALTNGQPPLFEPGQGFHYSDSGYFVLGAIIERVSGTPFGQYLEDQVFRPIGMSRTWHVDGRRTIPHLAAGYSVRAGVLVPPAPIGASVPYAAGGVFSTVDDLWRWDTALRQGRVVTDALRQRAWSPRTLPDGAPSGYGYGWKVCTLVGRRTVEHGGFLNGYQASLLHLLDEAVTVVVLVNNDADAPDAGALARRIARLVATGTADIAPHSLSRDERLAMLGHYATSATDVREIRDDDGVLSEVRRGVRRPLVALGPNQLAWVEGEESVVLSFDASGGPSHRYRSALRCEPMDVASRQP